MTRKPFKPTPLAVVLQAASLLAVAGGVFAILITDITRHASEGTKVEDILHRHRAGGSGAIHRIGLFFGANCASQRTPSG